MSCHNCQWKHSYDTVTFQGEIVREGTICELDAFCWTLRIAWAEMTPPLEQPPRAAQRSISELMGLDKNPNRKVEGTPFG